MASENLVSLDLRIHPSYWVVYFFLSQKRAKFFSRTMTDISPWKTSFHCLMFNEQAFLNFFGIAICLRCDRIRKNHASNVRKRPYFTLTGKPFNFFVVFFFTQFSGISILVKSFLTWKLICNCRFPRSLMSCILMSGGSRKPLLKVKL